MACVCVGLIRCPGHIGPIQLFTQGAVFCKLHHGQITRHFQGEFVALFAQRLRSFAGRLLHIIRHAVQLVGGGEVRVGIGGVQRVFAEFLAEFGLAFLYGGKPFARGTREFRATQHKVADGVFVCLALLGVQG